MKKRIITFLMKKIKENKKHITIEEEEKITYGLENIYLSITKLSLILLLSIFLNIFKETILVCISFNFIRFFAFGLHAKNSLTCFITSTINFIGGALLAKYHIISKLTKIIISIICIIIISIYAPADTEKHPLLNKQRRHKQKILSIIFSIILSIIIYVYNNNLITNYFIVGFIEAAIMILPITYKLYGLKYNNYKEYGSI